MVKRHLLCPRCKHVVATSHRLRKEPLKQGMAEDWSLRSDCKLNEENEPCCAQCDHPVWFNPNNVVLGGDL